MRSLLRWEDNMEALILRLDAPMMSFGTVLVDQHGFIDRFPGTSMLCGLIANALGWTHGDFARLQALQERIEYAARWDVEPIRSIDYHTVDISQPKMRGPSWTTRGIPEEHGSTKERMTHERYRHYWEDGLLTIALTLTGNDTPSLMQVKEALERPARPLFLGRKVCLPARPLLDPLTPVVRGDDLVAILRSVPVWNRYGQCVDDQGSREACWPGRLVDQYPGELTRAADVRDWTNNIPAGSTMRVIGVISKEA